MNTENAALLANANFRRLFGARLISNIGNGMQPIALAFGILAIPGSTATSLSIVLAAQAVTVVLTLPWGGAIADRVGAARMIAGADIVLFGFVLAVAVLFMTGTVTIPLLVALSACMGVLNGLWYPAYIGLTPDVVGENNLQPANAFMAMANNGGFILGTAIGGLLVTFVGSGIAIAIDAFTFLIAGLLVFSFRYVSTPRHSGETMLVDLVHGWRVFTSFRWVVVIVAAFSFVVMAWRGGEEVMGPVLANESYGGPAGWALVLGFQSVGFLVGAYLATRVRARHPMRFGMLLNLTLPIFFILLALRAPLPVVIIGAFAWGVSMEVFAVLWYTALQANIPREALSRVSAYDFLGSLMFGPIGLAVSGPLIAAAGLQAGFFIAATVCLVSIVAALLSRSVRQLRSSEAVSGTASS